MIAEEGAAIYQVVKDKVEECRSEFQHLEEAVQEQMSGKTKKKKKKGCVKPLKAASSSGSARSGGNEEFSNELPENFNLEDLGSDSGESLNL